MSRRRHPLLICLLALSLLSAAPATTQPAAPYLFTYFLGNGEDGLHLAASDDGYTWRPLKDGKSFLKPSVGESKLMRDPCIARGPDGTFHMVWTTAWQGKTIGYASSKDLITWSQQRAVPVMGHEPGVINCWAPEIVYDDAARDFVIFWASSVPGKFTETIGTLEKQYNHRMYYTRTADFQTFAPTKLFYDPGFAVIDATFLRDAYGKLHLIIKDETLKPTAKKHLRIAPAESLAGPFGQLAPAFTKSWVEGPTGLRVGDDYVVYFDCYRDHRYGAMRSRDLKTWEDVSDRLAFPKGARHGTIIQVPPEVIARLKDH